jgi:hypothetical protein
MRLFCRRAPPQVVPCSASHPATPPARQRGFYTCLVRSEVVRAPGCAGWRQRLSSSLVPHPVPNAQPMRSYVSIRSTIYVFATSQRRIHEAFCVGRSRALDKHFSSPSRAQNTGTRKTLTGIDLQGDCRSVLVTEPPPLKAREAFTAWLTSRRSLTLSNWEGINKAGAARIRKGCDLAIGIRSRANRNAYEEQGDRYPSGGQRLMISSVRFIT